MFISTKEFTAEIDSLIRHVDYEASREVFFKSVLKRYSGSTAVEREFINYVSYVVIPSSVNSKRYIYNSSIVSLYGFLENYLEKLVKEFVCRIDERCNHYGSLPESIKKIHLDASIDLLKKKQRDRNSTQIEKENAIKEIVKNMNSCIHELDDFKLNEEAFSIHTANFRYDTIHTLFSKVGVRGISRRGLDKKVLEQELTRKHSIDTEIDKKVLVSLLISELDDLAQRRNEVSHGSSNSNIESIELFKERAILIRCFGEAISEVLIDYYYIHLFDSVVKIRLNRANKVFTGINVFGFTGVRIEAENHINNIELGDEIFAVTEGSSRNLIHGKIVSMRKSGEIVLKIDLPIDEDFAFGVDFSITSHMTNRDIYVVKGVTH